MAPRVEQLIEEIKALPLEDQQLLRETLADATPPAEAMEAISAEEEFKQRLLEAGIIKEIKRPPRDLQQAHEDFLKYQPIQVRGKPISETIIEERR